MKKYIAFLLCLITILSLVSCDFNNNQDDLSSSENGGLSDLNNDSINNNITSPSEAEKAMQMYEAAINDEICVFDSRLGEIKLKSLRIPSNDTTLNECKLLTKAILDIDQDGVNEYIIKSPNNEYFILRYYNGNVHSYCLDAVDFYNFNTDGSFHWYDSSEEDAWMCGLNKIVFNGEMLTEKSIYSLKYSKDLTKYEYFIEGEAVTCDEYFTYRNNIRYERMKFSQFELTNPYPITAQQAWNLANEYWDHQDGVGECSAGTIWIAHIALIDKPNSETNDYRFVFQVEWNSGGGQEGYECMPPHDIQLKDQILVDAFTGEIRASTYAPNGKGISVEEAIEIAKNYRTYTSGYICNEENGYRVEHVPHATAPAHYYVIMIQKYDTVTDVIWIDKYTGKAISPYYVDGKG